MKIKNHKLEGDDITFTPTPNISGKFSADLPDTIIIHYTAGSSVSSAVRTLTNPAVKASAHLVVGKKGEIEQLAPFDTIAWHAGKSQYEGRYGFNKYSIGIEIDNAGVLTKGSDGYYSWFKRRYDEADVIKAIHRNETEERYWEKFTDTQIQTVFDLCQLLISSYNIKYILGHEEIAPKRKIDPGPAFPLDDLRNRLLFGSRDHDEAEDLPSTGKVIANTLNIRKSPTTNADKIADPLPSGTEVKILEERDGWYFVKTEIKGWVSSKYIK